ncbi:hypothetical protein SI859A1_00803 [Aurantimonas manganoxydans SI85-9A1]|uniref:SnoaL-like domain-containing protein n=2 Tax=Aurantimonas manganoxydans TaxID=651183 RepID=Q1YK43_AURMS|nr:hypothetical protein SI859A1_00803 [Aurantimonas manganoxydans SI85-9A1]
MSLEQSSPRGCRRTRRPVLAFPLEYPRFDRPGGSLLRHPTKIGRAARAVLRSEQFMVDTAVTRRIVEEVMEAVMAGAAGSIARHFVPGAMVSQRSNAAMSDAPWFGRMEGEFRLQGEEEARAFFDEMLKRTTYISYDLRGIVCEDDNAASRCDWTRRDEKTGTLITGTTMYWFAFTSDARIRSIETIGSIHSVIPLRKAEKVD